MYLTEIEIKDWCQHKHIHEKIDDPVVGLMGPNGAGKTNFLEALKFAFTGLLRDNQETYVRNFGTEDGPNNASVRVVFRMGGVEGEIFRQVGKTAKRRIKWDNREETTDKGCNKLLSEIFEADREAIANAVFISQGTLDKMLFGKPSERYELFVKLLLLAYLEKRAKIVESKGIALSNGLQDFTTLQDDLRRQEGEVDNTISAIKGELAQTRSWGPEIRMWNDYKTCEEKMVELSGQISQLRSEIKTYESNLVEVLGSYKTFGELESTIADLREKKDGFTQERQTIRDWKQVKKDYDTAESERNAYNKEHSEKSKELEDVIAERGEDSETKLSEELKRVNSINDLSDQIEAKNTQIEELKKSIEVLEQKPPIVSADRLDAEIKELEELREQVAEKKIRAHLLSEASTSGADSHDNTCPICKGQVGEDLLSPASVEAETCAYKQADADLVRKSKIIKDWEAEISADKESLSSMSRDMLKITREVLALIQEKTALGDKPKTLAKDLEIRLTKVRELDRRELVLKSEVASADRNKRVAQVKLGEIDYTTVTRANNVSTGRIEELDELVTTATQELDKAQDLISRARPVNDLLNNRRGALENNLAAVEKLKPLVQESIDSLTPEVIKIAKDKHKVILEDIVTECPAEVSKDEVQAVTDELNTRQEKWNTLQGQLSQANTTKHSVQMRREEMERQMEADKNKRQLIEELKQVKEMLGKNGIVTEIINDRYARLVELTQEHLANLDSNFMIEQDPDNPVSVRFWRVDKDSQHVMSQEKLSGGQRVRFTVAFLLALQQLIIPEVGFLVLDEPSVHVDEPGVESIKELLISLGSQLGSADAQVIVCDHHKSLEPAFGEVIRLK